MSLLFEFAPDENMFLILQMLQAESPAAPSSLAVTFDPSNRRFGAISSKTDPA